VRTRDHLKAQRAKWRGCGGKILCGHPNGNQVRGGSAERAVLGCESAAGIAKSLQAQPQPELELAVSKGAICFLAAAQFKRLVSSEAARRVARRLFVLTR